MSALNKTRKPKQSELVAFNDMLTVPVQVLQDVMEQIKEYSGTDAKQKKKRLASITEIDKLYEFYVKYATEFTRLTGMVDYIERAEQKESKLREGSKVSPITEFVQNANEFTSAVDKMMHEMGFTIPESVFPKSIFED